MTLHFRPENAKKNKKELKKSQQPPLRDYCMQVKRQLEAECNGNMEILWKYKPSTPGVIYFIKNVYIFTLSDFFN